MPWDDARRTKQWTMKKETRESRETWRKRLAKLKSEYDPWGKKERCLAKTLKSKKHIEADKIRCFKFVLCQSRESREKKKKRFIEDLYPPLRLCRPYSPLFPYFEHSVKKEKKKEKKQNIILYIRVVSSFSINNINLRQKIVFVAFIYIAAHEYTFSLIDWKTHTKIFYTHKTH